MLNKKRSGFVLLESLVNLTLILAVSLLLTQLVTNNERHLRQLRQDYAQTIDTHNQLQQELAQYADVP